MEPDRGQTCVRFGLFSFFQSKDKFGTHTFGTDYIDVLVMSGDDFLYDGKSQPGSFAVTTSGGIQFVKAFPDFIQARFRDTLSGIFY